jgi:hypothetical protein
MYEIVSRLEVSTTITDPPHPPQKHTFASVGRYGYEGRVTRDRVSDPAL